MATPTTVTNSDTQCDRCSQSATCNLRRVVQLFLKREATVGEVRRALRQTQQP